MIYRSPLLIGLKAFFDTFKTLLNVLVDDWRYDKGYDLMAPYVSIASIPPVKIPRPLTGPFFPLKIPERFILKFKFSLHSFNGSWYTLYRYLLVFSYILYKLLWLIQRLMKARDECSHSESHCDCSARRDPVKKWRIKKESAQNVLKRKFDRCLIASGVDTWTNPRSGSCLPSV